MAGLESHEIYKEFGSCPVSCLSITLLLPIALYRV